MTKYLELIERTHLVRDVESRTTTGDPEYPGTALEVEESGGDDLFHVVVDSKGERQVLFFAHSDDYRIPLDLLERLLVVAREQVRKVDE